MLRLFTIYGVKRKDGVDLVLVVPADTVAQAEAIAKANPSLDCSKAHFDLGHSSDMDDPKSARMVVIERTDHCGWNAHPQQ